MRTSLTRVGLRFLLILVVVMALWLVFLEPGYDRFVARTALAMLRLVESPPMTAGVEMDGHFAVVTRTPLFASVSPQRLELRTHHNNAPLLIALVLATPGLVRARRDRLLAVALVLLAATHVLHFVLAVQMHYAAENTGPYRVTDWSYLGRGLWESRDNPAQVAKIVVARAEAFYTHVGRLIAPILIWMLLCWPALRRAVTRR